MGAEKVSPFKSRLYFFEKKKKSSNLREKLLARIAFIVKSCAKQPISVEASLAVSGHFKTTSLKHFITYLLFGFLTLNSCGQTTDNRTSSASTTTVAKSIIDEKGMTIRTRFNPPDGFKRKPVEENSFAFYLRNLPLKPSGTKVKYYNGDLKQNDVYDAVVDMEISNKDLQQCADAVMRLRGEYFYSIKAYDQISFTLTNGFKMDYTDWTKGNRVIVNGNKTVWHKTADPSNTYKDFRNYMEFVFTYAGTLSLSKSLHSKNIKDLAIGDVFILGGSPGHAVIVVDVAENKNGEKVFLLAQSYMPAQETQILKNNNESISPWYSTANFDKLYTPEWTFDFGQLKTW